MPEKSVILFSSANDAIQHGDFAANGGTKMYHLYANLLIAHGYEAYVVTYAGTCADWLIHPAPHISIEQARQWKAEGRNLKYVTWWLWAKAFMDLVDDRLYYGDLELAFSADYAYQRRELEQWMAGGCLSVAVPTHYIQDYYRFTYQFEPPLIPVWAGDYWRPAPEKRVENRIGYFREGQYTESDLDTVGQACAAAGIAVEFLEIGGHERTCLEQMQSCDVYLGLGRGKHPKFGEGGNLGGMEAQHAGCVVVMYDVYGNRQYILDGQTGALVERGNPQHLALTVASLLQHKEQKEALRGNGIYYALGHFNAEMRWPLVKAWLQLD